MSKYEILILYTMFLMVYLTISAGIGYTTSMTAEIPTMTSKVTAISSFFGLFNISTPIGILNAVLVVPYLIFLGLMVANYIRGVD
jgi:hypothetical protein